MGLAIWKHKKKGKDFGAEGAGESLGKTSVGDKKSGIPESTSSVEGMI